MARGGVYRVRAGKSPLGPTEQDRDPLWNRKVSVESHRARKFPYGAARCPGSPTVQEVSQWSRELLMDVPKPRPGPPSLSPPLTLAAAPAAAVLALAGPCAGAGVTWRAREGERDQPGDGKPGVRREAAGTGRGTYRRHTCSPGGPWLGSARLGLAQSSSAPFGSVRQG